MRKDMAKVIVERPRYKDGSDKKGRRHPLEELPSKIGMRRAHKERGTWKMLNENLSPLRRYLEKQVGRPWNKVYAEIAAGLRVSSTVQQHVRDHIKDFVVVKPRRGLHSVYSYCDEREGTVSIWWQRLYVDPNDGILKRTDRLPEMKARKRREQAEKRKAKPVDRKPISPDRELRQIDGLWYEVTLAAFPMAQYQIVTETKKVRIRPWSSKSGTVDKEVTERRLFSPPVFDVVRGATITVGPRVDEPAAWREFRERHPDGRYAIRKRQLSSKELRQHGVTNASAPGR